MAYKLKHTGEQIDAFLTQISEGGGVSKLMTEVNYEDLVGLRDSEKLVPGMKYRITDYETVTLQPETKSGGHFFDVVVTAIDNKTLSEDAEAMHSERDVDGYFSHSNLGAWKIKYRLTDNGKFSWASSIKSVQINESEITLTAVFTGVSSVIDGVTWWEWTITYNGMSAPAYTNVENPVVGDLLYETPGNSDSAIPISVVTNPSEVGMKGVIYEMTDEFNNTCCYDFKNIIFKGSDLSPEDLSSMYPDPDSIPESVLQMMAPKWAYTFNEPLVDLTNAVCDYRITKDGSLHHSCHDNKVGSFDGKLNRVIMFTIPAMQGTSYNNVANGCHDIILWGNHIEIGSWCYNLNIHGTYKVGNGCHDICEGDHGGLLKELGTFGMISGSAAGYKSFTIENNCYNIDIFHWADSSGSNSYEHIKVLEGTHDVSVQDELIDFPYNINYISADMNGSTKVWSPADEDFYIQTYSSGGPPYHNRYTMAALKNICTSKRERYHDKRFPRIIVDMSGLLNSPYSIYTHPLSYGGYIDSDTNQFKLMLQVHLRQDGQDTYMDLEVLEDGTINTFNV